MRPSCATISLTWPQTSIWRTRAQPPSRRVSFKNSISRQKIANRNLRRTPPKPTSWLGAQAKRLADQGNNRGYLPERDFTGILLYRVSAPTEAESVIGSQGTVSWARNFQSICGVCGRRRGLSGRAIHARTGAPGGKGSGKRRRTELGGTKRGRLKPPQFVTALFLCAFGCRCRKLIDQLSYADSVVNSHSLQRSIAPSQDAFTRLPFARSCDNS